MSRRNPLAALFCSVFSLRPSTGMRTTHETLGFHPPFFTFHVFGRLSDSLRFQPRRFVPKCPDAPILLSLLFLLSDSTTSEMTN